MTRRPHRIPSPQATEDQSRRLNDAADAFAELLDVRPEAVMTEPPARISLTIAQAERIVELAATGRAAILDKLEAGSI